MLLMQGSQVQSLVKELRSLHALHAWPKTKQNKTKKTPVDLTRKEGRLPRSHVHPGHGEFSDLPLLHCHVTLDPATKNLHQIPVCPQQQAEHTHRQYVLDLRDYPDMGAVTRWWEERPWLP